MGCVRVPLTAPASKARCTGPLGQIPRRRLPGAQGDKHDAKAQIACRTLDLIFRMCGGKRGKVGRRSNTAQHADHRLYRPVRKEGDDVAMPHAGLIELRCDLARQRDRFSV